MRNDPTVRGTDAEKDAAQGFAHDSADGISFRTYAGAAGWREYMQVDGRKYYHNTHTLITQWAVPPGKSEKETERTRVLAR